MALPVVRHLHSHRDSLSIPGFLQRSVQSVAFSTPLTVDTSLGEIVLVGALTGNITISAPTNPYFGVLAGQMLTFVFTQDGTGSRTVTWNAVFKTGWFYSNAAASSIVSVTFIYDGTNWQQLGPIVDTTGRIFAQAVSNQSTNTAFWDVLSSTGDHIFRTNAYTNQLLRLDSKGHWLSPFVGIPTTGTLDAGVTSATVTGNDVKGSISIVTTGTPSAQNTALFTVSFVNAYPNVPRVSLTNSSAGANGASAYAGGYGHKSAGTSSFIVVNTGSVMPTSATVTLDYLVLGN